MPVHREDLTGRKFGRLTVVSKAPETSKYSYRWHCVCDCGKTNIVRAGNLRSAQVQSCGCLYRESRKYAAKKHGQIIGKHPTPEYTAWAAAKGRCYNPKNKRYVDWGGRGIRMCDEWLADFASFFEHVGRKPKGTSLDRIDNNNHYQPGNVRWATPMQQRHNRRDSSIYHLASA